MSNLTVINKFCQISHLFRDSLLEYEKEYGQLFLPHLVMASFSRCLAENFVHFSRNDIHQVFDLVESILKDGDDESKALVSTSFLESLQHMDSYGTFDFSLIVQYLGPISIQDCKSWDKFTNVRTRGLD